MCEVMMPSVNILKVGYSVYDPGAKTMKANCTSTLVQDGEIKIVVDTLSAWDGNYLKEALEQRKLSVQDVTHVVCTHGHSDHVGNLNLFLNALHIVGQSINRKDSYDASAFNKSNSYKISEYVEVIATPGHTFSDVSVIVKGTSLGTVAIVGDLFEREEDIKDWDLWLNVAGSENPQQQLVSRNEMLLLANYIIPGHGPGFYVTEELRKIHLEQDIFSDAGS